MYWRNTAQGLLIHTGAADPVAARGAAADLWHQLDAPRTEPDLCARLALASGQPLDEVAQVVRRVLADLRAVGAVTAS